MGYGNILSSGDKISITTCGTLKDFLPEDSSRNTLTESKEQTLEDFLWNVAHNQFDRTHWGKLSATVVSNCRYHCHNWRHS